jgi:hypothetical protein
MLNSASGAMDLEAKIEIKAKVLSRKIYFLKFQGIDYTTFKIILPFLFH